MIRSDLDRLRAAWSHASDARDIGQGFSGEELAADPARLRAILFCIVVVGETLGRVEGAIRMLEPEIPWRDITDTRNQIIHAYWQINVSVIVQLINRDLPLLIAALNRLVVILERDAP